MLDIEHGKAFTFTFTWSLGDVLAWYLQSSGCRLNFQLDLGIVRIVGKFPRGPVTKQYDLVLGNEQWCSVAGKVTMCLPSCELEAYEWEMSTPPTLLYGIWHPNFVFTLVHHQCLHKNNNCRSLRCFTTHHNHFTAFFRDHLGKTVPEENFWTLWCKGRLTEADTLTIWLGATPSGPTGAHLHHPPYIFTLVIRWNSMVMSMFLILT